MRIGSLFSGYGGLETAVQNVLGGTLAWVSDIDPGACKILAHHHPNVPNLGDITAIDWASIEPVDIITGGFPCQDVSMAGRRAGMKPGNRSGLWSMMAGAIDTLRPSLVVAENVRGLLSADGHADVEPCPWCMGDPDSEPPLRALGGVLGDLADIGYDAAWYGLTAASVGAPHGRFRVFIIAWPTSDAECSRVGIKVGECACSGEPSSEDIRFATVVADSDDIGRDGRAGEFGPGWRGQPTDRSHGVADSDDAGLEAGWEPGQCTPEGSGRAHPTTIGSGGIVADAQGVGRHERWPEPAGVVGGSDASISGASPVADPASAERGGTEPNDLGTTSGSTAEPRERVSGDPAQSGGLDGNATEGRPDQDMPRMWGSVHAATVQRETGGSNPVPIADDLLQDVWENEDHSGEDDASLAGAEATQGCVSGMWDDPDPPRSSRRSEPCKQCGREPGNPVRVMPSAEALARGPREAHGCDTKWGQFEAAIYRWEPILGRVAPAPTESSSRGGQRLSPRFVEWMQGLAAGHVTDVPDLSRNDQLKALGNGVVPQQAEAALRYLLTALEAA